MMANVVSNNGPVDTIFKAIKNLIPHDEIIELYQISAVTGGTDSQATATVRLRNVAGNDNKTTTCSASDLNVLIASALAYINCLNKISTFTKLLVYSYIYTHIPYILVAKHFVYDSWWGRRR
jgi:hypothetical protein